MKRMCFAPMKNVIGSDLVYSGVKALALKFPNMSLQGLIREHCRITGINFSTANSAYYRGKSIAVRGATPDNIVEMSLVKPNANIVDVILELAAVSESAGFDLQSVLGGLTPIFKQLTTKIADTCGIDTIKKENDVVKGELVKAMKANHQLRTDMAEMQDYFSTFRTLDALGQLNNLRALNTKIDTFVEVGHCGMVLTPHDKLDLCAAR